MCKYKVQVIRAGNILFSQKISSSLDNPEIIVTLAYKMNNQKAENYDHITVYEINDNIPHEIYRELITERPKNV